MQYEQFEIVHGLSLQYVTKVALTVIAVKVKPILHSVHGPYVHLTQFFILQSRTQESLVDDAI